MARAASRDEVRPILTGVLVQAEGTTLTMVATDSYRLSVKHTELEQALPEPIEANVPARALRELARIVAQEGPDDVSISLARNQAVFQAGSVVLFSRLIEGQFPSWRQLIPESFEHEVQAAAGGAARGRPADQPAGAAQRPAAVRLRRGGADRRRRDAGGG